MTKIRTPAELSSDDWDAVHRYRNSRALHRQTKIPRFKAELEAIMALCEDQARERGIPRELMLRWRAYPRRGRPPVRRDSPDAEDRRMWDAHDGKTLPPEDAGELLDLLERSVAEAVQRRSL